MDAGLPLTVELAERVVDQANRTAPSSVIRADWVSALNFVYGAMVGYQAEDGGNPLQAVNIERLISALRLLQNSAEHEVAPFVSAWKPGALGVGGGRLAGNMGQSLVTAIEKVASGGVGATVGRRDVVSGVSDIARAATRKGNPEAFVKAENMILESLSELLGDLKTVEYLAPLAELALNQPGGLDVVTLNYDLAVEQMATDTDTEIERGIGGWKPGSPLRFPSVDGRINLYKLHGSLDWVERRAADGMAAPEIEVKSVDGEEEPGSYRSYHQKPWIVVGDREKLATDGPTLALLRAAEDALRRTTHLVVIGYSFSDAHINSLVRNWMLGNAKRTIGIVDTQWDRRNLGEFRTALLREYGSTSGRRSRVVALPGTTKDRIREALVRLPDESSDPYATVQAVEAQENLVRVSIRLHGPDLYAARINVARDGFSGWGVDTFKTAAEVQDEPQNRSSWKVASFEHWVSGSEVEVFARGPVSDVSKLSIYGDRLDGATPETFDIDVES
ncbi:SIR2 family protein [Aeromicrobium panaciterrae]|uniref:SIR2 family protein n=1 Tax=Aeromicrobium panaciterrae TaxID=363861 RepID=UPI0031DF77E9